MAMMGGRARRLASLALLAALLFQGPAWAQLREVAAVSSLARAAHSSLSSDDPFANPLMQQPHPNNTDTPGGMVPYAPAPCDLASAVQTATVTLGQSDVTPPCIVVTAGDLVTWVNPLDAPISIRTGDNQVFTEDVVVALSTVDVPAQGAVTVRVIHAGRIDYAAPDRPGLCGTILILGHEAA
jgi:hypothetical protein